jgi:hypothetical protein
MARCEQSLRDEIIESACGTVATLSATLAESTYGPKAYGS